MTENAIAISKRTARRYILGRQGLWPGRRWAGKEGTEAALRQAEAVQVDTVAAVARNHDLVLWSRVDGYDPAYLDELLYRDRLFFDYGGILMIYPMSEIKYWRAIMLRRRKRWSEDMKRYAQAIEFVRRELRERGPLPGKEIDSGKRTPGAYRGGKESSQALYAMWQLGELMTHSRKAFNRVYDFAHNVLGESEQNHLPPLPPVAPGQHHAPEHEVSEAEHHLALKAMRDLGLGTPSEWSRRFSIMIHRKPDASERKHRLAQLVADGELARVHVEGRKEPHYMPAEDLPTVRRLEAGDLPDEWRPLGTGTDEEANFIAPLDNVIWDRARLKAIFDFDYTWEVYKPTHQRRYGYYTMPILWGDRFVGRLNPRLDRKAKTLIVDGFWPEDDALAEDELFARALAAGIERFAAFHDAKLVKFEAAMPERLRHFMTIETEAGS